MYIYRRLLRIWSLITYLKIIDIKEGEPYLNDETFDQILFFVRY